MLLFSDNKNWKKKSIDSCFEVTMGSFDGAEICQIVGLYIQLKLEKILPKPNFGLYRDDRLALLRNINGQQTEKVRKNVIGVFKDIGFSLEIETNLKEAEFKFHLICEIQLIILTKSQTIDFFTFIVYQTTHQTS